MAELSAWRRLSCAVWTKIAAEILSRIWCDRLLCQALAESGSVPWIGGGRFSGLLYIPHAGRAKNLIFQHDWKIESWNPETYQRDWNLSGWKFLCSPGDNVSHGIAEDWSVSRVNIQRSCFSSYYYSSTAQSCGKLHGVFALVEYLCETQINERIVIKRKTSDNIYENVIIEN